MYHNFLALRPLVVRFVLLSSAVCSVALHLDQGENGERRAWSNVLILGCSVDRYAMQDVYGPGPIRKSNAWRVVYDKEHKSSLLYMFHRGVGLNGDMQPPFYISQNDKDLKGNASTDVLIASAPRATQTYMHTTKPDVVVVDSSLWDLSGWNQVDQNYDQKRRVQRWCDHDLPGLLNFTSATFPSSRIVFRTAPALAPGFKKASCRTGVEVMYQCITSHTRGGKLFNQYEILDYHKIMAGLVAKLPDGVGRMKDLWREDGYHPGPVAGKLYMEAIYNLVHPKQAGARLSSASPGAPPAPTVDPADTEPWMENGEDDALIVY